VNSKVGELDLSIIIISFNTRDLLRNCIKSIYETTDNVRYEIIIVDNGSDDGSIDMLAIEFPEVNLIENKINLGFAKANNQAIKIAQGRSILLLNSDTIVKKGTIESLAEFMKERKSVAAVGPKVLNVDGTLQSTGNSFPSIGDVLISLLRIPHFFLPELRKRLFPELFRNADDISRVGWIQGCCIMFNKHIIDKIGPLDEDFFFFCEEIEWCYRARKSGYHIYYNPYSEIVHYGGASNIDQPSQRLVNARALLYKKCFGKIKGFIILFLTILSSLSTLAIAYASKADLHEINSLRQNIRQNAELIHKLMVLNKQDKQHLKVRFVDD